MFETSIVAAAATAAVPGSIVGLLTGLVPGLHENTIAHIVLAYPMVFLAPVAMGAGAASGSPDAMACAAGFLFGVALGHAFTDDIPAVYLGAPNSDTALSTLPGHRLLEAGLGDAAVRATAQGSLLGVLFCLPLVPVLAWLMGPPNFLYEAIRPSIWILLVAIAAVLIASERGSPEPDGLSATLARLLAVGLLLGSGALGEIVMFGGHAAAGGFPFGNGPPLENGPLLALFAGLFGIPTLLLCTLAPARPQPDPPRGGGAVLDTRTTLTYAAVGTVAGAVVGWLPAMGAAQAATLAFVVAEFLRLRPARGTQDDRDAASFLVAAAAVGTANLTFNLVALSVLQRERSGVMVAVNEVAGPVLADPATGGARWDVLLGALCGAAACLPLCYTVARGAGRGASRIYRKVRPQYMAMVCAAGLVAMIFVLEGPFGLLVAGAATALGLVPPLGGVKRVHLMGCVLIPVSFRIAAG